MTAFEILEGVLFAKDGFVNNHVKPFDEKYWHKIFLSHSHQIGNQLSYKDQKASIELFGKLDFTSLLDRMLTFVDDVPLQHILLSNRYRYYKSSILFGCYAVLKEVSESIRLKKESTIDQILVQIRWLVFEVNSYLDFFGDAFELIMGTESYEHATENDERCAMNFLLTLHFRDSLILLWEKISLINGNYKPDSYFASLRTQNNSRRILFSSFDEHISERISVDKIERIIELYRAVKDLFYESRTEEDDVLWFDDWQLQQLEKIENVIFCKHLLGRMVGEESAKEIVAKEGDLFENIYANISNLVRHEMLPSSRMYLLESLIETVVSSLDDNRDRSLDLFYDSMPRKLVRRLEIDYQTIKANPKIDLKMLDLNSIKPIQTTVSVSQLALLFKTLEENAILKVDVDQRTEFYRTITKTFTSKSVTGSTISEKSFRNKFSDPDKGSYKFWKEKFRLFSEKYKNFN